jgi:hypothetical protein
MLIHPRRATSPRQQVAESLPADAQHRRVSKSLMGWTPVLLMPIRQTTVVAQHWINGRGCLWVPASPPRRWPAAVEGTLKPSLNFCLAREFKGHPTLWCRPKWRRTTADRQRGPVWLRLRSPHERVLRAAAAKAGLSRRADNVRRAKTAGQIRLGAGPAPPAGLPHRR